MPEKEKKVPLGVKLSEAVAEFVGTWSFIAFYTLSMMAWILLHNIGILDIDSNDFIKWNLWLSYFAGIQASILLMASNRELEKDRKESRDTLNITKENSAKITEISRDLDVIEELLGELCEEEEEGIHDKQ